MTLILTSANSSSFGVARNLQTEESPLFLGNMGPINKIIHSTKNINHFKEIKKPVQSSRPFSLEGVVTKTNASIVKLYSLINWVNNLFVIFFIQNCAKHFACFT